MILEDNASNEDILDQLEKIEAMNTLHCLHHENSKIAGWSS